MLKIYNIFSSRSVHDFVDLINTRVLFVYIIKPEYIYIYRVQHNAAYIVC